MLWNPGCVISPNYLIVIVHLRVVPQEWESRGGRTAFYEWSRMLVCCGSGLMLMLWATWALHCASRHKCWRWLGNQFHLSRGRHISKAPLLRFEDEIFPLKERLVDHESQCSWRPPGMWLWKEQSIGQRKAYLPLYCKTPSASRSRAKPVFSLKCSRLRHSSQCWKWRSSIRKTVHSVEKNSPTEQRFSIGKCDPEMGCLVKTLTECWQLKQKRGSLGGPVEARFPPCRLWALTPLEYSCPRA